MVVKKLKEEKFKQAKLAKKKRRREGLARDRRIAEREGNAGRNDLLPELAVRKCPISELQPPSRRTRKNAPEQIERICASISEFGRIQPTLVRNKAARL